ncbi:putative pyruvate dehydrogenase [Corchorus capsularis]|uniref:Putative pyruvate dehydrogenase n=1 Tax=Corchorus capsularis TaxID=210143 RepID=A0A1R3K4H7_COCAP|nr:putative pyruvate dehydrogenase [Corchorus capsularis]
MYPDIPREQQIQVLHFVMAELQRRDLKEQDNATLWKQLQLSEMTVQEALNSALDEEMATNPRVFIIGEEFEKIVPNESSKDADRKRGGTRGDGDVQLYRRQQREKEEKESGEGF